VDLVPHLSCRETGEGRDVFTGVVDNSKIRLNVHTSAVAAPVRSGLLRPGGTVWQSLTSSSGSAAAAPGSLRGAHYWSQLCGSCVFDVTHYIRQHFLTRNTHTHTHTQTLASTPLISLTPFSLLVSHLPAISQWEELFIIHTCIETHTHTAACLWHLSSLSTNPQTVCTVCLLAYFCPYTHLHTQRERGGKVECRFMFWFFLNGNFCSALMCVALPARPTLQLWNERRNMYLKPQRKTSKPDLAPIYMLSLSQTHIYVYVYIHV